MQCGHLIYNNEKFNAMPIYEGCVNSWDLINNSFTLIEEQTIDIDSIEELKEASTETYDIDDRILCFENRNTINELVQAVKHLNKEIQSIKK